MVVCAFRLPPVGPHGAVSAAKQGTEGSILSFADRVVLLTGIMVVFVCPALRLTSCC